MFGVWSPMLEFFFFFFQAEDGIRDLVRSRGLGDVYKRQGKGKGGKGKGKRGKGKHGKGKGRRYRVEPRVQYLDFSWYSPSVPAVLPDPTRRTVIASSQMLEYMNNVQDVCASLIASS
eukprot:TRINITY_DN688_c0_g1_i1.p1 TRINITY_DN688_c0_g1~~TRINITY_DN688_c0_g1_i1.p1  ORF type:complete len:118 (-),score=35.02 TRINITY_DN688_c0_g1_i1:253-606(-)